MRYLIIDGMIHGTGIRDKYKGGYLPIDSLGFSEEIKNRIREWLNFYEQEHYAGFIHPNIIDKLDKEGIAIAKIIKTHLPDSKVEYYSNAKLHNIAI